MRSATSALVLAPASRQLWVGLLVFAMAVARPAQAAGDPRCSRAERLARCAHPALTPARLGALARAARRPSHPLFLVDRARAIPADFPLARGSTWRSCRDPRPGALGDLVCLPVPWTNRFTALRLGAWDAARPRRPVRTHDGLPVGHRGRIGFKAMLDAGLREGGVELFITSAFRPYAVQAAIFEDHVAREMAGGLDRRAAVAASATYSARPGHSEHQLGTTADLTYRAADGGLPGFGRFMAHQMRASKPMRWVRANAHRFGIVMTYRHDRVAATQYVWEPWHWRFVGVEAADAMVACDLSVAEYLEHLHRAARPPPFEHADRILRDDAAVTQPRRLIVARPGERVTARWWVTNLGSRNWSALVVRPVVVADALRDVPSEPRLDGCVPVFESTRLERTLVAPAAPGRHEVVWQLETGAGAALGELSMAVVVVRSDGQTR